MKTRIEDWKTPRRENLFREWLTQGWGGPMSELQRAYKVKENSGTQLGLYEAGQEKRYLAICARLSGRKRHHKEPSWEVTSAI